MSLATVGHVTGDDGGIKGQEGVHWDQLGWAMRSGGVKGLEGMGAARSCLQQPDLAGSARSSHASCKVAWLDLIVIGHF